MTDQAADPAGWTADEAVAELDPPMDAAEVRALICAFRIREVGRPAPTYDRTELLTAHAAAIIIRTGHPELILDSSTTRRS